MNELEEMGRVDAEKAYTKKGKSNLAAEKNRIVRGLKDGGSISVRDINKNGKKDGFEIARAKGMAKGMGREFKAKDGGKATYKTKDGRTVKKGLYYYMNRAKKRGTSKPGKGSVTDKALRDSAKTAKKD